MKISLKKATKFQCEYTILRNNNSVEVITLDAKTYLLHDICHFVVERHMGYRNGFWGMLAQGQSFNSLFGKHNPQTADLRFIEQIVGPVQSVYSGHIPEANFRESIGHLDVTIADDFLTRCLAEVKAILDQWEQLPMGQHLTLEWTV